MTTAVVQMSNAVRPGVSRREFLKGTGVLAGTLWASSSALLALAPSPVWALEMKAISEKAGKTLLVFTRHIFPHDKLDDAVYAMVVKDLDAEAASSAETKALLTDGVAALDRAAGGDWLALAKDKQFEIVKSMAGKPLFDKVRGKAVVSLYNNDLAFAHFGYEGNAWNNGGGYIRRGFNDLKWLPAPSAAASPQPFLG